MEALQPGSEVGHLRIEEELGRGGFATVYRAEDTRLGRRVALKVLHSPMERGADPTDYSSFLAEARVIARLESPYIVTLFSLREAPDGALMLEMEFVSGGTLDSTLQRETLGSNRAESTIRDVLQGLASAHEGGVLHRDVKPANILLAGDGAAKLTDFGLARMIGDDVDLGGGGMGTPLYMAPEVLAGERASEQSDLWSVGVVAYEILAGKRPFPTDDVASFFVAVQNEDPAPLPPTTFPQLRTLVTQCLQKDPAHRPASCREALALLAGTSAPAPVLRPPDPEAPAFHGRTQELDVIEAALHDQATNLFLVTGVAGIGKSALCGEAALAALSQGFVWIDARLSSIESPLLTLVEAVRRATAYGEDAATSAFGPEGEHFKAILRGEEMPPFESPQQTLWTLQHLLLGVARARPLVLCVDNAQHASEEDIDLLANLALRMAELPFTLLIATRPAVHATASLTTAKRLDLDGLDQEALFAFMEDSLHAAISGRTANRVHMRTEGNPLHAIELMRHLEETGALERKGSKLVPTDRWEHESVPARLRDVVHARLASLDDESRSLLEVAGVDGLEFDGRAVADVLGLPMLHVLRQLQTLSRSRTLISRASHGYRFSDRLTQEVLYEDMAPELRVELHRALAEHLERRDDDSGSARLGRHWERCGDRKRAAPHLLRAAHKAQQQQEIRRMVDLATRAGMLEDPPLIDLREHAEVAFSTAGALMRRGDHDASETLYERLSGCATESNDEALADQVLVHRANALLANGRRPEADETDWEALAGRLGNTAEGGGALAVVGRLAKFDGNLEKARRAFEAADRVFRGVGSAWRHSMMQDQLGSVAMREGRLEEARTYYGVAAEVADGVGFSHNAAISRTNAALAHMLSGHVDGVDHELRRSIRNFDLSGSSSPAAHVRIYLAEALYAQGNTSAALEAIDTALPVLAHVKHRVALTNAWRLRAELLTVAGRLDDAKEAIGKALEYEGSEGDRTQRIVAHAVESLIATLAGREQDATLAIDAMRRANPEGTTPADGAILALCEAVLFGLPPSVLEVSGSWARSDLERLLRDATLCHARGEPCDEPLHQLEATTIGLRRATYRLLVAWLAAESARRAGDMAEAKRRTAAAREAAATLGHVRALEALSG